MRFKVTTLQRLVLLSGLLWPTLVHAQVAQVIDGRITDPSGALVSKAKVIITRASTGVVARSLESNPSGIFTAPGLTVGAYNVRVEAPGFKTFEQTNVMVDVNSTVQVDVQLSVGNETQDVIVQANPVSVQAQTSDLSTLINGQQIDEIDTDGRDIFKLMELVPGASSGLPPLNNPVAENASTTISFNGERSGHNLYLLDGAEINDRGCSGCWDVTPSQNAISEFKVITGNAAADVGMASGGFTAFSTRSGTHDFHGQAWEYVRNDDFDTNDYIDKQNGTPKPELRYNLFGFNIGGPVVIPHVYGAKRDKTFFFYNMEWRRLVQGQPILAPGIPASQFTGNFGSNAITVPQTSDPAAIATFASYGLAPGQAFPNNIIPAGLIDPNVALLLKAGIFPAANAPNNNYSAAPPNDSDVQEEVARVDHRINDKFSLMASLLYDGATLTSIPPGYGATYPTDGSFTNTPSYAAIFRLTQVISPTLVNEPAFNSTGNEIKVTPTGLYALPSGYAANAFYTGVNTANRIPDINLGQPYGVSYTVGSNPWFNQLNIYEFKDDLSWTHGRHSVKVGGSVMWLRKYQEFFGSTQGTYGFSGSFTGNSFADLLLGYAASYSQLQSQTFVDTANRTLAFYGLDDWRATPRLTINAGLRWEYLPHTYDLHNRLANFNPATYNPANAPEFNNDGSLNTSGPGFSTVNGAAFYLNGVVIAGQNGTPRGLVESDHLDFGPRVGFAYQLNNTSSAVLRGGFGMFYERISGNDTYGLGPNPPFSNTPSANNVYFSRPATSNVSGATASEPVFPSGFSALNPYYPVPVSMQYNLGIQQQVTPIMVASLTYAGDKTYHQSDARDINTVPLDDPNRLAICGGNCGYNGNQYNQNLDRNFPGFASIGTQENFATSTYNSLQAALNITARRGMNISVAYTWSHSIDVGSYDGFGLSDPYSIAYDKGNADQDRRQIAKVSYYYTLPFFETSSNILAKTALSGWQISGVTTMETGTPTSVNLGYDNTGLGGNENSRADQVAQLHYTKTAAQWVSYNSFAAPAPLVFGNSARNLVYQPGLFNWDLGVFKSFPLGREGTNFEFHADSYNVFNHTEFNGINNNFSNGPQQFGQATSVYEPRIFQLGGSLHF